MSLKNQLIGLCKQTDIERKQAIIQSLNELNINYKDLDNNAIVVEAKNNDGVIVLSAHYDVYPKSFGYNDNGVALLTILQTINKLPDNVEVVFTNMEEWGGRGASYYLKKTQKNIIGCINLDVCGIGDYVYADNYGFDLKPLNCKLGNMPFNDGHVFAENNIPTLTFSTSYKELEFKNGITEICCTMHGREKDNDISIINFDNVHLISDVVLNSLNLFKKC